MALHVLWRALALILLGTVLNFLATPDITHFRLPGILQRIGLCYGAVGGLSLLIGRKSDVDFTLPTAILMGSEGEGVNKALLRRADETFIIPQMGTTDSLNVSVATGVILYEVLRQRL